MLKRERSLRNDDSSLKEDFQGYVFHYMYPSLRRVSSPPPSSLSWARPARSAMLANLPTLSSAMISATVRASDSTGKVQG